MTHKHTFEQRWREHFQRFGQKKDDDAGIAGWSPTGLEARLRHFATHWKPLPVGNFWVDAGCGAGTYTRHLVESGMQAVGLDYSLPSLVKARNRSPGIPFAAADVTVLPLKTASADGAICFGVTQALSGAKAACTELVRVVKPGGQVWIDGLNRWSLPHLFDAWNRKIRNRPIHLRYESASTIIGHFQSLGLINTRLIWLPILPAHLSRFQWLLETRTARWLFRHILPLGMLFSHSFVVVGEKA